MRARRETRGWAVRAARRIAPGESARGAQQQGFGARLDSFPSQLRGLLPARFESGAVTVRTRGGGERTLELRPLSSGGSNTVYTIPELPGSVLRVSSGALSPNDRRAYYREIAVQRKLAAMGLSPRVVAVVYTPTRVGVIMERFDATLEDVLCNEEDTRRVFLEHDGEGALIELMMLVSRVSSCVDTKAANVVLRLDPVEFAVIDVDPYFCGARRARAMCASVDFAMCVARGSPASAVHAAVSLLILTLEAARTGPVPLPRIVDALLGAWPTVKKALHADRGGRAGGMGAEISAMAQIKHYTGIRTYAGVRAALSALLPTAGTGSDLTHRTSLSV